MSQGHVELEPQEIEEAEERALPRPQVVFESIRKEGELELERAGSALVFSGLAAGLSMGFSLIATAMLHARLPNAPWRPLVEGFGYSTGFVIVVLGRQQLFTENTLTAVLPALVAFRASVWLKLARLWILVLGANLVGCALVAFVLTAAPVISPADHGAFAELAPRVLGADPLTNFWRAIFAGWLVALMVWLLPASDGATKPVIIVALTYLIAISGFPHIIAGSVETFYALFGGLATPGGAIGIFFVPTLCGNIIGGVLLVSLLNFGQVVADYVKTDGKSSGSRRSTSGAITRHRNVV